MDYGKAVLITIIVFALGVIVLPNTVSLFAGEHYWYNLSGTGNNVPCVKCHADVYEELKLSAHRNLRCEDCHRANKSITYASVSGSYTNVTPGKEAHAASCVACMLCHQINASQASRVPGPYAGGFNVTLFGVTSPYNYSNSTYNGICEAHNSLVAHAIAKANNSSLLLDSTEACLSCHADIEVKMNFNVSTGMNVYAKDVVLGYNATTGINESEVEITGLYITDFKNITEVKPS